MAAVTASLCCTLLFVGLFVFVSADQKNITVESGQNVTLTCRAENKFSIIVAEWSRADLGNTSVLIYRDGHHETDMQHPSFKNRVDLLDRQMKDGDVSLILKEVMINDAGTYECRIKTGTNRRKRAILDTDPICTIYLVVVAPPGQPGGTTEDGGKKDGGKKDGGKEDGHSRGRPGMVAGLSVAAVLLVAAVVGFLIYRKQKKDQMSQTVI